MWIDLCVILLGVIRRGVLQAFMPNCMMPLVAETVSVLSWSRIVLFCTPQASSPWPGKPVAKSKENEKVKWPKKERVAFSLDLHKLPLPRFEVADGVLFSPEFVNRSFSTRYVPFYLSVIGLMCTSQVRNNGTNFTKLCALWGRRIALCDFFL